MILAPAERKAIEARVAEVEARTGVEIVTAIVAKAYAYPQLPWKAFALGTVVAALVVVIVDALHPRWPSAHAVLAHAVAMLGAGALCALLTIFVPWFARLFLRHPRRDLEVRRYAESLFVQRGVGGTRGRTGVLLLISLFERRIEVLSDVGFRDRVEPAEWHGVMARMRPKLREGRAGAAMLDGLAALEVLLLAKGFAPRSGGNELSDRPLVAKRP